MNLHSAYRTNRSIATGARVTMQHAQQKKHFHDMQGVEGATHHRDATGQDISKTRTSNRKKYGQHMNKTHK